VQINFCIHVANYTILMKEKSVEVWQCVLDNLDGYIKSITHLLYNVNSESVIIRLIFI
jgi:hypothetical protein